MWKSILWSVAEKDVPLTKREYALAMPTSYVDIDRDEMEYVDGGFFINANKVATITAYINGALGLTNLKIDAKLKSERKWNNERI